MKQLFTIALLSLSSLYAQDNASLKGKISNPINGKCYLYVVKTDEKTGQRKRETLDSSEVTADGRFAMSFQVKELTQASFDDGNEQTTLLLNQGDDLYLTLNTKMFDETITYTGKGSEKNNAIKNLMLIQETLGNEVYGMESKKDTATIFSFIRKSYSELKGLMEDYKKDIPELEGYLQSEYKMIDKEIEQTKSRLLFNSKMEGLKGTNLTDFAGVDLKGNNINISSFKGKTTVIDFWATWCGPCKAEIPSFKALEEKYGSTVNFVSVGLYCEKKDWTKMATDFGLKNNLYIAKEGEKQLKEYDIRYIPRYIVVDANLKIVDALAPRPSSGDLQKLFN